MSLYSPSKRTSNNINGVGDMNDGSGTINPAALTGNASLPSAAVDANTRSLKRSRSPDHYGGYAQADDNDDSKPRKRGRNQKLPRDSSDFTSDQVSLPTPASQTSPTMTQASQQMQMQALQPVVNPTQASPPPKATQSKPTLKALPTVRDHTSDQLNPEGDEYIAREYDDAGEGKVDVNGYLQGVREYKIRTFTLPGRGEKLFMLATECARTLQYRDSYLLFNKNRSLHKIIAQPKEKEELVARDILPYSYRSRQIAIVTARSMFRQFGSRVIKEGRRVRDDYWEAKARKQGFTEEDAAGEKRPGAARAREAALEAAQAGRLSNPYGDIVYSNGPAYGAVQPPNLPPALAATMAQLPMIDAYESGKYRDIKRPLQEITGPAYTDMTKPTTDAELASQSSHAADYSKNINAQTRYRHNIVNEYWHRPHEPPVTTPQPQVAEPVATSQAYSSPRFPSSDPVPQPNQSQPTPSAMNLPSFAPQPGHLQSPVRQNYQPRDPASFTPQHAPFNRPSSSLSISQTPGQSSVPFGGAGFNQMASQQPQQQQQPQSHGHQQQSWGGPPAQPHQSPSLHRMSSNQFSPNISQNQIPSPMQSHQSQSPHPQQMQPPQMNMMHPQGQGGLSSQQLYGPGAGLQAMSAANFGGMGMAGQRAMYGMGGQGSQYMPQPSGQPPQGQSWAGAGGNPGQPGQNWQAFQ